jgi:hypothetical protein
MDQQVSLWQQITILINWYAGLLHGILYRGDFMSYIYPISGVTTYPLLQTNGMIMSNSTTDLTNDIAFTSGYCTDDSYTKIITGSAIIKQLDSTFAEGSSAGMLINSTAKSNLATYYIYSIGKNSNASAFDFVASTSLLTSSTQLPNGWDLKRQQRIVKTDSVGVIHIVENRNDVDTGLKLGQFPGTSAGYVRDAGNIYYFKVQSAQNTTIQFLRTYIRGTTNGAKILMGIYSDNGSNAPSTLLSQSQEYTIVSASDNDSFLTLALRNQVNVTKDGKYWLCFFSNQAATYYDTVAFPGQYKYQTLTYTSTLPSTATVSGDASVYIAMQAF